MSLNGKLALVASAGGKADAAMLQAFTDRGVELAVLAPSAADIAVLGRELDRRKIKAAIMVCDLRYEEDVVRAVHRVSQRYGRIDAAINAAAVAGPQLGVVDYPIEPWRDVIATNVTGAFLICREVLPWMLRQKSGLIVNVTDRSRGLRSSAYQLSVRAVESFTRLLAEEVAGCGIHVMVVDAAQDSSARHAQEVGHAWDKALQLLGGEGTAVEISQDTPAARAGRA